MAIGNPYTLFTLNNVYLTQNINKELRIAKKKTF